MPQHRTTCLSHSLAVSSPHLTEPTDKAILVRSSRSERSPCPTKRQCAWFSILSLRGTTVSAGTLACLRFSPEYRRAELPRIRLDDSRHAYAIILLVAGKHPSCIQEVLRYSNITITLDNCSCVIEGMKQGWRREGRGLLRLYCCRIADIGDFGFAPKGRLPHR